MTLKISSRATGGFTLVEIIISASLALALFGSAYGLLTRGFFAGEKNLKNLSGIQEMSLIIYGLRLDLKAFHETEGDESTYLVFDKAEKKLSFSVVRNIRPDGSKEYCRINYALSDGGALIKTAEWMENGVAKKNRTQLAGNNGIREFAVTLFDGGDMAGKNAQGKLIININTQEYRDKYSYVKDLYRTLLERELGQGDNDFSIIGVPYWVARLYEGRSREDVKNCILDSEERFVLTCFKKYCKRAHTSQEGEIFTSRLRAGESRAEIEKEISEMRAAGK